MKIEKVLIDQLKHAEYNPRFITKKDAEQLKTSLKKFGFVEPIVVNKAKGREGVIVGGNQRFEAAKALGFTEVPVFFVDISDLNQEKELNIRLNRNLGKFDDDILANQFDVDDLLEWGFDEKDLGMDGEEKSCPNMHPCPICGTRHFIKGNE